MVDEGWALGTAGRTESGIGTGRWGWGADGGRNRNGRWGVVTGQEQGC